MRLATLRWLKLYVPILQKVLQYLKFKARNPLNNSDQRLNFIRQVKVLPIVKRRIMKIFTRPIDISNANFEEIK